MPLWTGALAFFECGCGGVSNCGIEFVACLIDEDTFVGFDFRVYVFGLFMVVVYSVHGHYYYCWCCWRPRLCIVAFSFIFLFLRDLFSVVCHLDSVVSMLE